MPTDRTDAPDLRSVSGMIRGPAASQDSAAGVRDRMIPPMALIETAGAHQALRLRSRPSTGSTSASSPGSSAWSAPTAPARARSSRSCSGLIAADQRAGLRPGHGRRSSEDPRDPPGRRLHARARLPAAGRRRDRVRHPHGPHLRPAAHGRPRADGRGPAPRRPVRGALPPDRRLLHGHEAAGQAGPGPGPRPQAAAPRRADERPRPRRPRRDARPDQADRHRVRDRGRGGLAPARRDRAGLHVSCWRSTPAISCGPRRSRRSRSERRSWRSRSRKAPTGSPRPSPGAASRPSRTGRVRPRRPRRATRSTTPSATPSPTWPCRWSGSSRSGGRLEDLFRDAAPDGRRCRDERPATAAAELAPAGSIYDLGYRHYEGKRHGRALRDVVALRREPPRRLGLRPADDAPRRRRSSWPACTRCRRRSSSPSPRHRPADGIEATRSSSSPTTTTSRAVVLPGLCFCVAQAPELVCRDQRYQVLPLYFTRAMGRLDYALARLGSLAAALFLAPDGADRRALRRRRADEAGHLQAIGDECRRPCRPSGQRPVAVGLAAISLAVSSFSPRRAYSAIGMVAYFLLMEAIPAAIFAVGQTPAGPGPTSSSWSRRSTSLDGGHRLVLRPGSILSVQRIFRGEYRCGPAAS